MGRVSGKVAIVTGASKGLGEADARLLAKEGAKVILTDVDDKAGEAVAADIGPNARYVHQDVRDEQGWITLIDDVMAKEGRLDILVNNAGVVEAGTIESQTADEYRFIMAVSSDGTFFGCKYAIPAMKKSGGGSIINMASIASVQGEPYVAAYCAAKGAVEALTRSIAAYAAQNQLNIRANSIHPSGIVTPMVMSMPEKLAQSGLRQLQDEGQAAGTSKLGEPNDIAYAVLYLASDESKFVNGLQFRIDAGMSIIAGQVPGRED